MCFVGYNERRMLTAEAATEREGWANFSTSSRAGKWLADTVGYFSGLFDINLKSTDIAIIIYKFDKSFKSDHNFFQTLIMKPVVLWWQNETVF